MRFKIIQDLLKIFDFVGKKRGLYFLFLQILSILSSMLDTISVGSIVPFIAIVSDPKKMFNNAYVKILVQLFHINNSKELVLIVTVIFIIILVFAAALKWAINYYNLIMTSNITSELATKLFKISLYQPYILHTQTNSSIIISGIGKASDLLNNVINPSVIFLNSFFTILFISSFLILLNPILVSATLFTIVLCYFLLAISVKRILKRQNIKISETTPKINQSIQEALGGIRDILLGGTQKVYYNNYSILDQIIRKSNVKLNIISSSPMIIIQTFGIAVIAVLAGSLGESQEINSGLPLMAALAFGYLRISPAIQNLYSSWVLLNSGRVALDYILNFFNESSTYLGIENNPKPINFSKEIKLVDINFRYNDKLPYTIKNLTLTIKKGEKIGLVGKTGSGKSTLSDIIMGLLSATSGTLEIDDIIIDHTNMRSWQAHIAHVPQSIYLSDATIAENIAFGVPLNEINLKKVELVAKRAQISETIDNWDHGYKTIVGERGIRLSGGQRQRIGIARALYKEADVIIFDEATSALDCDTELEVMKAIEELSHELTIIIIAHRTTTLKNCNRIVKFLGDEIKIYSVKEFESAI
jgi:ABC-type multidrug transport system fused ATPase/permease subunit